jgi:centrin-3
MFPSNAPATVASATAALATAPDRVRLREIREAFDYFDRNRDGRIDYPDFAVTLRSLGVLISETEVAAAKEQHQFPMTWEDFMTIAQQRLSAKAGTSGALHAFQAFDVRGRGKVAIRDLRHFMTTLGERITNEDLDAALQYGGIRADQAELDYGEFLKVLHASAVN